MSIESLYGSTRSRIWFYLSGLLLLLGFNCCEKIADPFLAPSDRKLYYRITLYNDHIVLLCHLIFKSLRRVEPLPRPLQELGYVFRGPEDCFPLYLCYDCAAGCHRAVSYLL